ncbi:MAG: ATP-binding protein [Verrucomicrobia bacterium]|nr:ATP-binding protein [Verrucomicrobiota bacterium]
MPTKPKNQPGPLAEAGNYSSILRNGLVCGVVGIDGHKKITVFSVEAERLTGLAAAALTGQPVEKLPEGLRKIAGEIFTTAKAAADHHIRLTTATGEHRDVRVHAVVTAAQGKVDHLVLILNDLAAAQQLEVNLRRLDRLANIGTLSASMAHEVKNAIVAVRTFVDLLLEKQQEAELAEIVGREMKRIDAIISQMLRVAGPAKPDIAPVRAHEALEHSLRLVQHQLNEKLITLKKSFAAGDDHVAGDLYQMEQAFMNLLLNAVEAMGVNGELTVTTEVAGAAGGRPAQFRITIQDTGVGITPENMGRLFETFFTTKKHGTGLGLPITRRIIEEHRGSISVASEPNQGATFTVLLPLAGG